MTEVLLKLSPPKTNWEIEKHRIAIISGSSKVSAG